MKLIHCPYCKDVKGLVLAEWRTCICGLSGGQYNEDGMTATLGGVARVLGIGNPFFNDLYPFLHTDGRKRMWKKMYGHENGDCWWGEYEGDKQIFRIADPKGPRLKVKVKKFNTSENVVYIIDKRRCSCDGRECTTPTFNVVVPSNQQVKVQYTRWDKFKPKKKKAKAKKIIADMNEDEITEHMVKVMKDTEDKK